MLVTSIFSFFSVFSSLFIDKAYIIMPHLLCHLPILSLWTCSVLSFSQTTNFRHFQSQKSLQRTISNLMKMAESYTNRKETLREKEKLLLMSNFSFSHYVFKTLVLQTRNNLGSFGKGLVRVFIFIFPY